MPECADDGEGGLLPLYPHPVITILTIFHLEYGLYTTDDDGDIENVNTCGICRKRVTTFCKNCNQALCFEVCHSSPAVNQPSGASARGCWEIFHGC